jgi:hypothetical protein
MKALLITGSLLLIAVLLGAVVIPADMVSAKNGPMTCALQTYNGHYLSAVGGGGRTTDVIHTDATSIGSWEKFTLEDLDLGTPVITYGVKTTNGHYLTVVGGGGRISDVIHSDATQARGWEQLVFESLGGGWYDIKTFKGNYLTATGGGGHGTEVPETMHSDATKVDNWEKFQIVACVSSAARISSTPNANKVNLGGTMKIKP